MHGTGAEDQEPGGPGIPMSLFCRNLPRRLSSAGTPERPDESSPAGELPSACLNVPESWQPKSGCPGRAWAGAAGLTEAKAALRASVLARRRALPAEERAAAGRQLRDAVLELAGDADGRDRRRLCVGRHRARHPRPALRAVEARDIRTTAGSAARWRPGLGLVRGPGFARARPARPAGADRAAPGRDGDHKRGPGHRARRWRSTAPAAGWAAAAAATTGPWPGSARRS